MRETEREQLLQYVEELAGRFAQDGLPLITGRIIGWLMVCDPPEQSATQIAEAIGASKASLSTNLRLLTGSGFVRTLTRPGERTTYYRVDDDAWATIVRRRLETLTGFRELTGRGIDLLGPSSPRSRRLQDAHDLFGWLEEELSPLWERWRRHRDGGR